VLRTSGGEAGGGLWCLLDPELLVQDAVYIEQVSGIRRVESWHVQGWPLCRGKPLRKRSSKRWAGDCALIIAELDGLPTR